MDTPGSSGQKRPTNEPLPQSDDPRARPHLSTYLAVAIVGGATAAGAYAVSGGSIPVFVAVMVAVGVLVRVGGRAFVVRQGRRPPRGWWL